MSEKTLEKSGNLVGPEMWGPWNMIGAFICQVPEAFQNLIDNVDRTMRHAIEVEEKIPMDTVTNFEEVKKMMPCECFIFFSLYV